MNIKAYGLKRFIYITISFILLTLSFLVYKNIKAESHTETYYFNPNGFEILREKYLIEKKIPIYKNKDEKEKYFLDILKNKRFNKILDSYKVNQAYGTYDEIYSAKYHLGTDYNAYIGETVYAPSNAYVFYSYGGYSGLGYIGNTTEAGVKNGGNQIILMSEVDDIVYGIIFLHLKDVYYNIGDIVHTGDIVGTAGQTGSADAPHLHVELYVLGPGHLSDYINYHYDYYFNVPRIYSNDINVYPYRTNPENVWN